MLTSDQQAGSFLQKAAGSARRCRRAEQAGRGSGRSSGCRGGRGIWRGHGGGDWQRRPQRAEGARPQHMPPRGTAGIAGGRRRSRRAAQSPEMSQRDPDSRYQLRAKYCPAGWGRIPKGGAEPTGRDLAIKVLLDQHKDKPEVIKLVVEEAQIGGQLQIRELLRFTNSGSSRTSGRSSV